MPHSEEAHIESEPGLVVATGYRVVVGPTHSAPFGADSQITATCPAPTLLPTSPPDTAVQMDRSQRFYARPVGHESPLDAAFIEIVISGPQGQRTIRAPAVCARSIAFLGPDRVSERALLDALPSRLDKQAQSALRSTLETLGGAGALRRVVIGAGDPFVIVEPLGDYYRFNFADFSGSEKMVQLVRFCLLRPEGERVVLESPLSHARVWILQPAIAAVVASLAKARPISSLTALNLGISERVLWPVLSLLIAEGFVTLCESDAPSMPLRQWEFHDLFFHTRSRRGRHRNTVGASFRFRGKISPPPATKPPMSFHPIALPRPDMHTLFFRDMPLTAALELRASIRERTQWMITLPELGAFLYRSARVRKRDTYQELELTSRPYPSGGASYELEIYPIVDRCIGLLSGVYHYDPLAHALEPLLEANPITEILLQQAYSATAGIARPQILLVITARFQRVSWKYESIAYATVLKGVGVLYQTMYLVATAMRLAPCAIGAGDSDLFHLILGNDYYEESSVGEFMLGARALT
jgi:oxazoline/thiazoline dehydrogenase